MASATAREVVADDFVPEKLYLWGTWEIPTVLLTVGLAHICVFPHDDDDDDAAAAADDDDDDDDDAVEDDEYYYDVADPQPQRER